MPKSLTVNEKSRQNTRMSPKIAQRERLVAPSHHPNARIKDRLAAFMQVHAIRRAKMAEVLQTPFGTLNHWIRDEANPPGVMLLVMTLLEQSADARRIAGIETSRGNS